MVQRRERQRDGDGRAKLHPQAPRCSGYLLFGLFLVICLFVVFFVELQPQVLAPAAAPTEHVGSLLLLPNTINNNRDPKSHETRSIIRARNSHFARPSRMLKVRIFLGGGWPKKVLTCTGWNPRGRAKRAAPLLIDLGFSPESRVARVLGTRSGRARNAILMRRMGSCPRCICS